MPAYLNQQMANRLGYRNPTATAGRVTAPPSTGGRTFQGTLQQQQQAQQQTQQQQTMQTPYPNWIADQAYQPNVSSLYTQGNQAAVIPAPAPAAQAPSLYPQANTSMLRTSSTAGRQTAPVSSMGRSSGSATQQTPYQSALMTGSRGFNPMGSNLYAGTPNSFSNTNTVYSAGGDAHMPAGTSNLLTAARIGEYQNKLQMAEAAMRDPSRGYVTEPRSMRATTGGARGYVGPKRNTTKTYNPSDFPRTTPVERSPTDPVDRNGNPVAPQQPTGAPPGVAQVNPTIAPDRPIFDQNFIQRLTNQTAGAARRDPREIAKMFDIPGVSRDQGQWSLAVPGMAASRASANRAMADIPLQAELANRLYQLEGQVGRGEEALRLADILRQLQGARDLEHTSMLSASLDPLVALLAG